MLIRNVSSRSTTLRRGAINRPALALVASAFVLVALVLSFGRGNRQRESLVLYCAAGLREPMEAIRKAYAAEQGVNVTIQYGGSNTLLANLKLNQQADLFLPADDSYITLAQHNNLLGLALPVAQMRPVLAVKKGNPQMVRSLDDVLANDVRISMTDPDAAATGKLVRDALSAVGKWDEFKSRVTVFKASVTEVAADLQVGAVDVGIVWDAMLTQLTDLEAVPLPELARSTARVVIAVTAASKQPHAAADFARYVAAADRGQRRFQAAGFAPPAIADPAEAAR